MRRAMLTLATALALLPGGTYGDDKQPAAAQDESCWLREYVGVLKHGMAVYDVLFDVRGIAQDYPAAQRVLKEVEARYLSKAEHEALAAEGAKLAEVGKRVQEATKAVPQEEQLRQRLAVLSEGRRAKLADLRQARALFEQYGKLHEEFNSLYEAVRTAKAKLEALYDAGFERKCKERIEQARDNGVTELAVALECTVRKLDQCADTLRGTASAIAQHIGPLVTAKEIERVEHHVHEVDEATRGKIEERGRKFKELMDLLFAPDKPVEKK